MKFTKMHGVGNDYVFVDCFSERTPSNPHGLAVEISDRHRGIGADGLILIEPSNRGDARIRMYNSDGNEAIACGNGVRCVAKYLFDHKRCTKTKMQIESDGGLLDVDVFASSEIAQLLKVDMGPPILDAPSIPADLPSDPINDDQVVDAPMDIEGLTLNVTCVSLGQPHCVVFVEQLHDELVYQLGPIIESSDQFPYGTSVEFVEVLTRSSIRQRTWAQGGGEVLANATSAGAACVAGVLTGRTDRSIACKLSGGLLQLEWDNFTNHVHMTGPAVEVFSGKWNGLS